MEGKSVYRPQRPRPECSVGHFAAENEFRVKALSSPFNRDDPQAVAAILLYINTLALLSSPRGATTKRLIR